MEDQACTHRIQLGISTEATNGASAAFEFLIPGESGLSPGSQVVWRNVIYDVATIRRFPAPSAARFAER